MEKRVDSVNTTPIVIAFVLLLVAFFALLNHQAYRFFYPFSTTSSGLSYKAKRIGNGRKAKEGEWVQLSIIIKESANKQKKEEKDKPSRKSSIFINSLDEPQPFILPFSDDLQNKAIKEMIGMVEEKQRVIFKFSPAYFFQPQKPEDLERILTHFELKENDELTADIEIDKIMSKEERIEIMEKKRAEQRAEQTEKDKQKIADYLKSNTIQALSTASGLFYSIDQPSQGPPVTQYQMVKVHYIGRLLDGTVFDTSIIDVAKENNMYNPQRDYQPFVFQVGTGNVIPGWDEGLLLLKKNEKARFFIPSTLAYGDQSIGNVIPANSVLIFEVEVVDVYSSKEEASQKAKDAE